MGSTRPIPMNATTDAEATAQTDFGWRHIGWLLLFCLFHTFLKMRSTTCLLNPRALLTVTHTQRNASRPLARRDRRGSGSVAGGIISNISTVAVNCTPLKKDLLSQASKGCTPFGIRQ